MKVLFTIIIDQYEPPFQSGDVTCDELDEFSCADGRECILKGNLGIKKNFSEHHVQL